MNTIPTPASAKAQYTYTPDRKREQAIVKPPAASAAKGPSTAHPKPPALPCSLQSDAALGRAHENPEDLQCGRWDLINQPVAPSPTIRWRVELFPNVGNRTLVALLGFYHRAALCTNR